MMKALIVAMTAAALAISSPQDQSQSTAAMYAAMERSAHHAQLDSLAGNWTIEVTFRVGSGREQQSKASSEAHWVLGGRFLEQHYKNDSGLQVWQMLGYDNQKKKSFEIKLDNMDTGFLITEGTISDDGKIITNYGDRTDPISGKIGKLRTVTTIVDHGHYTVEWYLAAGNGAEQKVATMAHTRQ